MIEIKTDTAGTVTGYASLFGRPADAVKDVVQPGAYAATLAAHKAAGTMPAMLLEHKGESVGTWTTAEEDALGLRVEGQLDLAIPAGRAAHEAVKSGRLDGLSIGFRAVKSDRAPDGARMLAEVTLAEISLVKRPASSRSRILAVKALPTEESAMDEMTETATDNAAAEETKALVTGLETKMTSAIETALKPLVTRLDAAERVLRRPGAGAAETKSDAGTVERKELRKLPAPRPRRHGPDRGEDPPGWR